MFLAQVAAAPILPLVADQLANNTKKPESFLCFSFNFSLLFPLLSHIPQNCWAYLVVTCSHSQQYSTIKREFGHPTRYMV